MGSAFQCDLCRYCEPGEPMVRFKLESTGESHPSEEWCDECLSSYSEWRDSRRPKTDDLADVNPPAAAIVPFPDVPVQGMYQ